MKLIDKDVLTEKLWERRIKHRDFGGSPHSEYGHEDDEILSLIDTLEVKEVDLEKEIEEHAIHMPMSEFTHDSEAEDFYEWAKEEFRHFFELGLSVNIKAHKGKGV